MTAHPDYTGARTRGSRTDRQVVEEFIRDPAGMKAAATAVRQSAMIGDVGRTRRPGVTRGLTAEHINAALGEWRRLGRDGFMRRYGGQPAERYVVITASEEADALALILGARALAEMDTTGPWRGDRVNVADPLIALGFRVETVDRQKSPEVRAAEDAAQQAAGRTRRGGQGFIVDQLSKAAVENHAMMIAERHFEQYAPS